MSTASNKEQVTEKDPGPDLATERRRIDVFEDSLDHDIRYKTLSWPFVALLMIAEIVSNGMLSLPSSLAVVGIVPAVTLIVFLGIFGLFTAKLLIDFKLNHREVHSMGDAGLILGGPAVREILSAGTILFAIAGTGSELLSELLLIFSVATLLLALPRTLDRLSWIALLSVGLITLAGFIAMIGAGLNPVPDRAVQAAVSTNFFQAFLAVTNPVFAYAGHFMFFILISEMSYPETAMKAAWCLQTFATLFYVLFSVVLYVYLGNTVASPALLSLPPRWSKAAFGIALGNFLVAGSLYTHTAAKLVFVRFFRETRHVYKHTLYGWSMWLLFCFIAVAIAFVFAIAVPIFSDLIGIAAALFASWFTYGIAGWFWLYDTFHINGGRKALRDRPVGTTLAVLTILAGSFICVAGTYVSVRLIVDAYKSGTVGHPFSC